ncbi:MAG TPA: hypothetical protein VNJ04_05155 [Gemmatimonadaceae bacterium]|nr:hypothetical protein [Gemmatimonadaceae bacterium]
MPRPADPINNEELFNAIELGGECSPGQVKSITGHERKINWDVKEGAGQSGASSTLKSIPLRTITVTFFLANEEQIGQWPAFRELCYSTIKSAKPKALDIFHPDLDVNDVRSVTLASMGGVVHDGMGGQTIAVQFQEYAPPKPKGGSATGSKSKKVDPNAAANAELAALTEQYKKTPWG